MSFVKELKRAFGGKRSEEDQETDTNELLEAGVSIKRGDPRLKKGLNIGNMTPSERQRIMNYRKGN